MSVRSTALNRPHLPARRQTLVARLAVLMSTYRQRQHLETLPDHLLNDIGLTREQAHQEASRSVWDAPKDWRR